MKSVEARIEASERLRGLRELVRERLSAQANPDQGHDLSHFLRVALWTVRLGGTEVEPDEAIAAALLHDIVAVEKNSPLRKEASRLCAEETARILPRFGFDAAQTARIADAVRCHSFSRGETPTTMLGKALQDADRLEALGALGIFRLVSVGSRMGSAYFHPTDPWARERPLDDTRYSVDHFFAKLLKLPDSMQTEAGRTEAEKRTVILRQFLAALGEELGT